MSKKQWFEEVDPIWEDNPFAVAGVIAGVLFVIVFVVGSVWSLL
jgi:hypothetical protein